MPKTKLLKQIDKSPRNVAGATAASPTMVVDYAPPARTPTRAPTNLTLSSTIEFATASPQAIVSASWDPPPGADVASYVAQIATSPTFPAGTTTTLYTTDDHEQVDFPGRRPGVTSYVRVAAVVQQVRGAWTAMSPLILNQNVITAAQDLSPASVPTAVSTVWIGTGDLRITWTNPPEANYKTTQIRVRASAGAERAGGHGDRPARGAGDDHRLYAVKRSVRLQRERHQRCERLGHARDG